MTTAEKVTAQQLYAEMDRATPGWREAKHPNFDAAVLAAGPAAVTMCAAWKKAFARKTDSRLAAKDERKAELARIAQVRYQEEHQENYRPARKEKDTPAFDQSSTGRSLAAEWVARFVAEYQPGIPESGWTGNEAEIEEGDSQRPAVSIGRPHDTLYHPERYNAKPWSEDFPAYVWNPVPPRSYPTSPRSY